ncbi:MAG TPA: hypothetical protein VJ521_10140, partial [Acidobacteriota bacterium]|nr:hypothetical protein [Acidobacteriota bacterium]
DFLVDGSDLRPIPPVHRIGLPDRFVHEYGTQESLFEAFGLETHHIVKTVTECVQRMGIRRN